MLRRLIDRLRLPFRKDRELRSALFRILGFYPQHIEYYKIAFAHKSQALRDKNGKPLNNERLEFLGDAVLESVVSDILFHHFEKRHEGFLTATRSKIVQRESLNRLAKEMGIDKLIQTSTRNHNAHSHLGGNAFEALMGAIYLDKGYKTCQKFVQKQILGRLMDLDGVANKEVNFKSKLLEWCQKNKLKQDFVMRLDDSDKQKEPLFYCTVVIESIEFGYGKGFSKKEAQQQAARETLTMLRRDENVVDSVFRSKEKRTAMEANEMAVLPKIDEIENDLLREQQQPKREVKPQPTTEKQQTAAKKQQQPAVATEQKKATNVKKEPAIQEEAPRESKKEKQPTPEVKEAKDTKPSAPEAPQKTKKEGKLSHLNLAAIAEAAIAEAETDTRHFPTVVEEHATAVVAIQPHSTAVVAKEKHTTAVVTTEPPRKREVVVVEDKKQAVKTKEQEQAPAVTSTSNVPVETSETETPKKEKRKRHKVSRIAEFTQTEVKSEEEVEAERQRIVEQREEKRRNKRINRESDRAKKSLETLTQPLEEVATNDILAEESLDSTEQQAPEAPQQPAGEHLSNSAKRRLRRKRAAERAQQEKIATTETPEATADTTETEQQQGETTAKPAARKKHQRGNSRKRRRQQATDGGDATAAPAEV